jgi:hypothetical protein
MGHTYLKPVLITSYFLEEKKNLTKTTAETFNMWVLLFQELRNTDVLTALWLLSASTAVL